MQDDIILDEKNLPEIKHLGLGSRLKIKWQELKLRLSKVSKKKKILIITAFIILVALIIGGVYYFAKAENSLSNNALNNRNPVDLDINKPEEPRDHISPLNGEMVTKSQYQVIMKRPPLAIIVENHQDARPQSGLDKADIVYETLVEGGITRFVPVFLTNAPEVVGPVRSIRKYFLDILAGLDDPIIMHIGGAVSSNPEANALAEIQKHGMKSLGISGGSSWRVSYRSAPHNAYTNTQDLWATVAKYQWDTQRSIVSWSYKDDKENITDPITPKIDVNWSSWGSTDWSVTWEFNPAKNEYLRYHRATPHIDAITEQQLKTKNVVIVKAPQYLANDDSARITYDLKGNGSALIFRDGEVVEATWHKPNRTHRFRFLDSDGLEVQFNRGQSWIMVVPTDSQIVY